MLIEKKYFQVFKISFYSRDFLDIYGYIYYNFEVIFSSLGVLVIKIVAFLFKSHFFLANLCFFFISFHLIIATNAKQAAIFAEFNFFLVLFFQLLLNFLILGTIIKLYYYLLLFNSVKKYIYFLLKVIFFYLFLFFYKFALIIMMFKKP